MGGGEEKKPENLLIILPFPEPSDIIAHLKEKHPSLSSIRYIDTEFTDAPWQHEHKIPEGAQNLPIRTQHLFRDPS